MVAERGIVEEMEAARWKVCSNQPSARALGPLSVVLMKGSAGGEELLIVKQSGCDRATIIAYLSKSNGRLMFCFASSGIVG